MNCKKDPYNHRLLDEFPKLKETYDKIKGGVFDLDTPSYSFYEEIFVPYFVECIKKKEKEEIEHCCKFIDGMMRDEDEKLNDIAMKSVLFPLYEKFKIDLKTLPLGKEAQEYDKNWLEI